MQKKIQFQTENYPLAVFINIIPLLGTIRGLLKNFEDPLQVEFFLLLLLLYILLSNIIRLTKSKKSIYVFKNRLEYFNMFGFKRTIRDDKEINIQELRVVHSDIIKRTGARKFILEVKALLNLKHGGQLKYKGKKLFNGTK